jgi:hypothetical protein
MNYEGFGRKHSWPDIILAFEPVSQTRFESSTLQMKVKKHYHEIDLFGDYQHAVAITWPR